MSFFDGGNGNQFFVNATQSPPPVPAKTSGASWAALGIAVISLALSLIMFVGFVIPAMNARSEAEAGGDLYQPPRDLANVVEVARSATVTVYCGDWSGSGWGIDLEDSPGVEDDAYPYEIVTNYHVIEECVNGGEILIRLSGAEEAVPAYIYSFDKAGYNAYGPDAPNTTDLAILMTATEVPVLPTAAIEPMPGDWLMAVGNPNSSKFNDMEGHVTFGRVSNFKRQYNVVVTDTAVNHGNSGGPLLNSRGEVVGTNTWIDISQQAENIAYALAVPKLCESLVTCEAGDSMLWGQ